MQAVMETAFDAAYLSSVITIGILMIFYKRNQRTRGGNTGIV